MDAEFLKLIRCPLTQTSLRPASEELLSAVNRQIQSGTLTNRLGQAVESPLEEGLVNADEHWLLPVRQGIAILVADQAIELSQISNLSQAEGENG